MHKRFLNRNFNNVWDDLKIKIFLKPVNYKPLKNANYLDLM